MGKKKKGKSWIIIMILALLLPTVQGCGFLKTGELSLPGIGKEENTRTTQTAGSRKIEKELEELVAVEDPQIREGEQGILELSGTCSFPDFSVYFEKNNEEASKEKNAADYEKQLLALTREDLKDEKKASSAGDENAEENEVPYVTRELTVNLSVIDVSRGKDEWKEKELAELLREEAFQSELEEFAFQLAGDYLSSGTDWEAEKAIWAEDAADNGEVQAQ